MRWTIQLHQMDRKECQKSFLCDEDLHTTCRGFDLLEQQINRTLTLVSPYSLVSKVSQPPSTLILNSSLVSRFEFNFN